MRPISKGEWPIESKGSTKKISLSKARISLYQNIGPYCCYCEEYSGALQNEHVISVNQDARKRYDWNNLLLGCGNCNGQGNKGHKEVNLADTHFPHLDNTSLSFQYLEGGKVIVNHSMESSEIPKAIALFKLVGLNKYPGDPDYDPKAFDYRWEKRQAVWEAASSVLKMAQNSSIHADEVAKLAKATGHFSIWFTLFANHPEVRKALIEAFKGTAQDCFDPADNYNPILRSRLLA